MASNIQPKLQDKTFNQLAVFIETFCGIQFISTKKHILEKRLLERLKQTKCETFEDYYYFLRYDVLKKREIAELFKCLSTNETSFFRNNPLVNTFENQVLPEMSTIAEKRFVNRNYLRIWSAGCSTGEEAYTISIILNENKRILPGFTLDILASDLDESVLKIAKKGLYTNNSIRNVSKTILNDYFTENNEVFSVKPELQSIIQFQNINLLDKDRIKFIRGIDIIFCRNVIIYFSLEAKQQVIQSFYDSLSPGGYLIIGHSESLHNIKSDFKPITFNRNTVYKKDM